MELQPGQVNWGDTPVHLYPGAVRLWLWTAVAHGAEFVTTYRYRQPRFGVELFHHGLVGTDGSTPTAGRAAVPADDRRDRSGSGVAPTAATTPTGGSSCDPAVGGDGRAGLRLRAALGLPASCRSRKRWDYARLIRLWYGAFARLGLSVRVLASGAGVAGGTAGDRRAGFADGGRDAGRADDQVRRDGRAPRADLPDGADGSDRAVLRGADGEADPAADRRVDRGVRRPAGRGDGAGGDGRQEVRVGRVGRPAVRRGRRPRRSRGMPTSSTPARRR